MLAFLDVFACDRRTICGQRRVKIYCLSGDLSSNYTRVYRSTLTDTVRGAAGPLAIHASRRATRFYSRYRLRTTWWAPEKSKDIVARARSFRVRLFWRRIEAPTRSSAIGTEVSAGRHKSACRSTAGEDQQALRICGSEGRRWLQACSTRYGCSARAMPTRLWAAGCSQPCHGVCVAD